MTPASKHRAFGRTALLAAVVAVAVGVLPACDDMEDQPRGRPEAASEFFPDGSMSRPLVDGTVARNQGDLTDPYHTGLDAQNRYIQDIPVPVTAELLARGRERFNIYCSQCHGEIGDAHGMVVQRGFPAPPSYHIDRLRKAPAGHFFDVITNGFGKMPAHKTQVTVPDRWAIIAYIRALQLSQNATLADVPPDQRKKLEATP